MIKSLFDHSARRPGNTKKYFPFAHRSNPKHPLSTQDSSASDSYENDDGVGHGRDNVRDEERQPLLPLFSAAHLGMRDPPVPILHTRVTANATTDRIPVYHLQHNIRLLVLRRCETTLSWDQLRSPQVSQFLVKPIQQEIRSSHYSRATLYALLANCLQFQKDGQENPGTVGVSRTRALVCELLAMRLLRESATREVWR